MIMIKRLEFGQLKGGEYHFKIQESVIYNGDENVQVFAIFQKKN